jgi:hypothetical protein
MYKMRKPLISATAEMSGFLLVEASAPSPGEHNVFWYASLTVCGDTPCGPKKSDAWINLSQSKHRSFSFVNQSCQTDAVNQ